MTGDHFENQMIRMYDLFGKKSYPQSRTDSIWNACRILPNESFTWMINIFIDSAKTAPLPKEFKELAYREKVRLGIEIKEPETKPMRESLCKDCGDSGNLFVTRKETYEAWAKWPTAVIRCFCEAGRKRPASQGPIYHEAVARSYEKNSIHLNVQGDWAPKPDRKLAGMVREFAGKEEKPSNKSSNLTQVNFNPDGPGAA